MYYFDLKSAPSTTSVNGNTLRLLANSPTMMAMRIEAPKGNAFKPNSHPHEQVVIVVSGKLEYNIGGEIKILEAGDSCIVPSNVEHSAKILEDTVELEVFTPRRDDMIAQYNFPTP